MLGAGAPRPLQAAAGSHQPPGGSDAKAATSQTAFGATSAGLNVQTERPVQPQPLGQRIERPTARVPRNRITRRNPRRPQMFQRLRVLTPATAHDRSAAHSRTHASAGAGCCASAAERALFPRAGLIPRPGLLLLSNRGTPSRRRKTRTSSVTGSNSVRQLSAAEPGAASTASAAQAAGKPSEGLKPEPEVASGSLPVFPAGDWQFSSWLALNY